ncbi:fibronectin type III domain-containing protein [Butyrivibrio sp. MB2005]|uniref:fibronectin type III domain-containing protein n=1 Tax=Butyrivibrio sp. MB2005 TaxID=1280678 RepID=UPI00040D4FBB|nr:fibronectin type III domain-containing protein [Butyrivibrio sp. MB2005]
MKKELKTLSRLVLYVAAFLLVFGLRVTSAKAYTTITQTAQTQNSVTINWNAIGSKDITVKSLYLGYAEDSKTASSNALARQIPIANTNATSYVFNGLKPGTKYEVYLYCDYSRTVRKYNSKTRRYESTIENKTAVLQDSATIKTNPGQVTGLNQLRWYRFIEELDIGWDRQTAADGYEYLFQNHKGKTIDSGITTGTGFSEKIKNYVVYKAQVRSYATINGVTYYGDWSPTAFFFTQPSKGARDAVVGAKISGSKLKVSWKKMDGVSGYNVYVSDKANSGYKKVKSVKANKGSVTVSKYGKKKFKKNKTYYIYVQAYKKVNGQTFTTGVNYITVLKRNSISYIYSDSNGSYK